MTTNVYNDTPIDKDRFRMRRSSLQTKLDRRRRKNFEVSQLSVDNSFQTSSASSQNDLTNDSMAATGEEEEEGSGDELDPNHAAYFPRQKRHSWWNIFVPDNTKNR